ncbi:MAG: CHAD domain-containing protein [Gemmataceae bacterium]|nr:CHAD domain-containing protein [Gemmataceae bacterium]
MADGKWITELTSSTPLADAARRVLAMRLEVVRDHLPLALREADKDPEHVHQLRVGTRRAGAALEIFSLCLPEKEYRAARKQLRRIRRAAGAARDWDVFLLALGSAEAQPERQRPAWDFLIGYATAQRAVAQTLLDAASPNHPFSFERLLAETVAAVHKPRSDEPIHVLLDLAKPLLGGLLRELHQAASGSLEDYDHLHQVRIMGKRLRYAMEVFADCFAPDFKVTLYVKVEEMQEILGLANDSHVANQRLTAMRDRLKATRPGDWRRYRIGLNGLLRRHRERVVCERQRFVEWWKLWQESGGETAFTALLKPAAPVTS